MSQRTASHKSKRGLTWGASGPTQSACKGEPHPWPVCSPTNTLSSCLRTQPLPSRDHLQAMGPGPWLGILNEDLEKGFSKTLAAVPSFHLFLSLIQFHPWFYLVVFPLTALVVRKCILFVLIHSTNISRMHTHYVPGLRPLRSN